MGSEMNSTIASANTAHDGIGNSLNNVITGNALDNTLSGMAGNDILRGLGGNDFLVGEYGNDVLEGGDGDDSLSAGPGDDTVRGGAGTDTIDGGTDVDTAVFSGNYADYIITEGIGELIITGPDGTVRLARDFRAEGVVQYILQACHTYEIEAINVAAALKEAGVPSLKIETDYAEEDAGRLGIRIEAFLESLEHRNAG